MIVQVSQQFRKSFTFLKLFPKKILKNIPFNYKYQYLKNNRLASVRILTDDVEFDTTKPDKEFNFQDYSNTIISMVNGSYQKFSIGIYGEWGTGKTTLMKIIERKLKPDVFVWEKVPGQDSGELKNFLRNNFEGVSWIDNATVDIKKSHDTNNLTISDSVKQNYLSIILKEKQKAVLEINEQKIYEFAVEEDKETHQLHIKQNDILTVWFNAWRYEREEQFALIPLMKTIAYAMGAHPIYKDVKPIIIRGLEILSKDILRNLATRYIMTENGFEEFEKKLLPKLESLPEIDKDTIYFDGIKKVQDEVQKIFQQYPASRIVVFIDDLDRCSPETALEVFESVKVFLDLDGFVFIIGLSREALDKLIKARYEKMGLSGISGEEYIRKIIQVEIRIQNWKDYAIKDLIDKLSKKVDEKYRQDIEDNKDLIAKGVELNPRQVKRLINRFIIALSINPALEGKKFLLGELLNSRWLDFYQFFGDPNFLKLVRSYLEKREEGKEKDFIEDLEKQEKGRPLEDFEKILLSYKRDSVLWDFLEDYKETVFGNKIEGVVSETVGAKEWELYQSASGSTNIPIPSSAKSNRRVLVIAGHSDSTTGELAALLQDLELETIFYSDVFTRGVTVIEKLTVMATYAFVLLSPEDLALLWRPASPTKENLMVQLGYFIGKLGRDRICLLVRSDTELPYELQGYSYITYKERISEVSLAIVNELRKAGYSF
jgi:hypothetical protein